MACPEGLMPTKRSGPANLTIAVLPVATAERIAWFELGGLCLEVGGWRICVLCSVSGARDLKSQIADLKVPNTKHKVLSTKHKAQSTKLKAQSSKPKAQSTNQYAIISRNSASP